MNRRWPDEATAFAESVGSALDRLGGVEFARRAERRPELRATELEPVLTSLGFGDVDVLDDGADMIAAAAAARVAGAVVAPWPIAAHLSAARLDGVDALHLSLGPPRRLGHLDLARSPVVIDFRSGQAFPVRALEPVRSMPLDPFGVVCALDAGRLPADRLVRAAGANVVLTAFYALGALERAAEMAIVYAGERRQFGQPIARFGAIQWRISDLVLACEGLAEMAGYTLAEFARGRATPADTMALRLSMQESARSTLANAHQIFGAIGLCEEHDLAVIDRHLQPSLRRGGGISATSRLLWDEVLRHGFDGLFRLSPAAR